MEEVLDEYQKPHDEKHPMICMDEASRQLLDDVVDPLPMRPGAPKRVDDKYERRGVRSIFIFYNPIAGWRRVTGRDGRTRIEWAQEIRHLLEEDYPDAETVTIVCDNLNTHDVASLYYAFDAETAGRLRKRLRLVHTPKNGSWLNMAEQEISVLSRQCLGDRRFATAEEMDSAMAAWQADRNKRHCGSDWRFTTDDARIKLKSLYPKHDDYR
jgi:hypothetical protein